MVPTPLILLGRSAISFKVVTDVTVHFFLEPDKLIFQRFNDGINAFLVLRMEWMQSVTLQPPTSQSTGVCEPPSQQGPDVQHPAVP